jgi:crossover junction endodeoxyribonuclease RusA
MKMTPPIQPVPVFACRLPFPPSVNTYYRSPGKGAILSENGRKYHIRAAAELMHFGRPALAGALFLRLGYFCPDRRRRDIDNFAKPVLDAIQKNGVVVNDSQFNDLWSSFEGFSKPGRVEIEIYRFMEETP